MRTNRADKNVNLPAIIEKKEARVCREWATGTLSPPGFDPTQKHQMPARGHCNTA